MSRLFTTRRTLQPEEPNNSVVQYETEVKTGKLLLLVHGTLEEVERAKDLLGQTQAQTTAVHANAAKVGV